jgi:hypothetical protein
MNDSNIKVTTVSPSSNNRNVFSTSLPPNSTQSSNFGSGRGPLFQTSTHSRNTSLWTKSNIEQNIPNEIEIDDVDAGDETPHSSQVEGISFHCSLLPQSFSFKT